VTELDNMTQQNAGLVEETASASEEMSSQAQELLSMMQKFKINDNGRNNGLSGSGNNIKLSVNRLSEKKVQQTEAVKKDKDGGGKDNKDIEEILSDEGFKQF